MCVVRSCFSLANRIVSHRSITLIHHQRNKAGEIVTDPRPGCLAFMLSVWFLPVRLFPGDTVELIVC